QAELGRGAFHEIKDGRVLVYDEQERHSTRGWMVQCGDLGGLPFYRPREDVLQEVEAPDLEIVNEGSRQGAPKELAELIVRRMAQIALQPVEIVEIDDGQKIGRVGHASFISGAVAHANADSDASNVGNRPHRTLEHGDELLAVVRREVRTGL